MNNIDNILLKLRRLLSWVTFESSQKYWIERYKRGDNSGHGSYGQQAQFKSAFLNTFVEANGIQTIIEYGCGDGNQLLLSRYPGYIGYDISQEAISLCKELFKNDPTKSFYCLDAYRGEKAQLTLSIDVIYHLVENPIFEQYMNRLFASSERFTIIYSTNEPDQTIHGPHIKHRRFTEWVQVNMTDWQLVDHVPGPVTFAAGAKEKLTVDFFVYQKIKNIAERSRENPDEEI